MICPYYNKPTREGLIAHYRAVADKVDIPIMLYNVPSRTGVKMEPETIAELFKCPNIVSIKEACGSVEQVSQIRSLCDINIMSGDDSLTLPMMAVGAAGVVSVAANVVPEKVAAMCNEFDDRNLEAAQALHYELTPLLKALFIQTNPLPVKAVLAQMGGDAIGAGFNGQMGGTDRIGMTAAARISNRGDVIDVHAKPQVRGIEVFSGHLILLAVRLAPCASLPGAVCEIFSGRIPTPS